MMRRSEPDPMARAVSAADQQQEFPHGNAPIALLDLRVSDQACVVCGGKTGDVRGPNGCTDCSPELFAEWYGLHVHPEGGR